mmetsp:Transcript_13148/g.15306  ORF Transcript_13148/g.15306 Transcript_13148/m.15306 type:complete len:352 (-) Transcript_13148:116-1171(-)
MRSFLQLALLSLSAIQASAIFGFNGRVVPHVETSYVFGVSRGGGLFGGKDKTEDAETGSPVVTNTAPATEALVTKYPAMSQEEVEEWLGHIPVFAVTDSKGQGVVLKPDNETSVFYFFMSPMMANATLQTLQGANEEMDLKIAAFSLGKIWFSILNAGKDKEVTLKAPGSEGEGEATTGVEYRLVPDTRDLMGARMLLTMDPSDSEKLKDGGSLTPEDAQAAIKKAMTESPKFKDTYNEIPVFMIAQMRMQKQAAEGEEAAQLLPMYFSLQNMVGTWQQFMSQDPNASGVEPAINLMDLHELVAKMQEESEIDFRNVLLIPPVPMGQGGPESTVTEEDPMSSMGGDTLGDL